MDPLLGYFLYLMSLLTMGGIYALLALGLNAQWGFAGLFNAGIAGFAAVGAYTYAILTTAGSPFHYGGLGLPLIVGEIAAMALAGVLAAVIGVICIRLRADYLAIATIGIAEIIKLVLKNETAITNGPRGINKIPRTWEHFTEERFRSAWPMSWLDTPEGWAELFAALPSWWWQPMFAATILVFVLIVYLLLERARRSPWGRMMAAIRENEAAAQAAGKDVTRRRIEAFIAGAVIMGLAGALLGQHLRLIDPANTFDASKMTFLVWVMLIAGGSGNNRGAILGAFTVWLIWSGSELAIKGIIDILAGLVAGLDTGILQTRAGFLRMLMIGLLLQVYSSKIPQGYPAGDAPRRPRQVDGLMRETGRHRTMRHLLTGGDRRHRADRSGSGRGQDRQSDGRDRPDPRSGRPDRRCGRSGRAPCQRAGRHVRGWPGLRHRPGRFGLRSGRRRRCGHQADQYRSGGGDRRAGLFRRPPSRRPSPSRSPPGS